MTPDSTHNAHNLLVYLPMDRRHALATGRALPEHAQGAVLFADISGFTPLTEALTRTLGPRRGAEELPRQLNLVYDALIAEVDRYGGSVIGFAGDAITCWFDGDAGLRATACALALQSAMRAFASLAIKVAVASGPVRRFLVGDPNVQLLDTLAGATLDRMAVAEQQAEKSEVVLDEATALALGPALDIQSWRTDERGTPFALVAGLRQAVAPRPWPPLEQGVPIERLRPWLLPLVYERLQGGQGEFLTELRPAVALFLRFEGIDYDADPEAGQKLDAFVRWVQAILAQYEGTLLQLTIGEKGNYLYAAFGAPIAHEDDARRAALAALTLCTPPEALRFISGVQIGLSRGTMRTGAYGGSTRRTYGALGDEVNLAARLMQHAQPGQIIASGRVQEATERLFAWQPLPAIQVKGKSEPIPLFALVGQAQARPIHLTEPTFTLPMVGRVAELSTITEKLALARQGQGQVVGITAEAGMGKSRLVAEAIRLAQAQGFTGYGGECQSYGTHTPYLVWQPLWRAFFALGPTDTLEQQATQLARLITELDPTLLGRLPLLGPVLNLALPETEVTRALSPELRKSSREALLVDLLKARAQTLGAVGGAMLLVLEDCHWLDAASHDLLEATARAIWNQPVFILLAYRPPELERLLLPRVSALPYMTPLPLTELSEPEMAQLAATRQAHLGEARPLPPSLLEQLTTRAQGNPFYLEELLNYLHDQALDLHEMAAAPLLEWPTSLHSLILSRIDRLTEAQKITLKVASVIGRLFRFTWLLGYYPSLGEAERVKLDLDALARLDLTPLDRPEPELIYLFKHIVTREVAYESLAYETRAHLHEQLAAFLEAQDEGTVEGYLDLLAYHYGASPNQTKACEYLRRAGDAAQTTYANEAALAYYERLLPLLQAAEEQQTIHLQLGTVLERVGQWEAAERHYERARALATSPEGARAQAESALALGKLYLTWAKFEQAQTWLTQALAQWEALSEPDAASHCLAQLGVLAWRQGNYAGAQSYLEQSRAQCQAHGNLPGLALALHYLGNIAWSQGHYEGARLRYEESLALRRAQGDKEGMGATLVNLSGVAGDQGNYEMAHQWSRESLIVSQEIGHKRGTVWALLFLGNAAYSRGEYDMAQAHCTESLALSREMGAKLEQLWAFVDLALIALNRGNDEATQRWGDEGLARTREMGARHEIAKFLIVQGLLAWYRGELERAEAWYEECLALCRETGDRWGVAYSLTSLGSVAWSQGNYELALARCSESLALQREIGHRREMTASLNYLGAASLRLGTVLEAHGYYREALQLAQEMGKKKEIVQALLGLAALAAQRGEARWTRHAARLLAAAERQRLAMGLKLDPISQALHDDLSASTRQHLSAAELATAWAESQALPLDEAVALALAE